MMPPIASESSPAQRQSRSSRDRIISRGIELFSERGYNGVSMSDIAQAAGVTKAALYYHFTDKESLFLEVLRAETARLGAELARITASGADLETVLRRMTRFLLDEGLGSYRQLQADLHTVVREERRLEHLRATRGLMLGIVPRIREAQAAGTIAADIDIETAVPLFFSMIGGQIRRFALDPDDTRQPSSNQELADLIVRIWLHGTVPRDRETVGT